MILKPPTACPVTFVSEIAHLSPRGTLLQAHGPLERPKLEQFGRTQRGFGVEDNEIEEMEVTELGEEYDESH